MTLDSNGGKILIGGAGGSLADAQTLSNGIGYALNASASLEAVSIGSSARVLSRGGDITINGYSTQPKAGSNDTTGVRIGASAIIDSGYYAPGAVDATELAPSATPFSTVARLPVPIAVAPEISALAF